MTEAMAGGSEGDGGKPGGVKGDGGQSRRASQRGWLPSPIRCQEVAALGSRGLSGEQTWPEGQVNEMARRASGRGAR